MARSRYKFSDNDKPYFMTCTVLHWLPVFSSPDIADIIISSLRYLQQEQFKLYAWVMLENHIHMIAQSPDLSKSMARFKAFTAKKILQHLKDRNAKTLLDQLKYYKVSYKGEETDLQLWQEGVHPQMIYTDEVMRQKIDYIHQNPVKRGFVDLPEHWRYSSARNYMGLNALLDVDTKWM